MGDAVQQAVIPIVGPGIGDGIEGFTDGPIADVEEAKAIAASIGYPVIIKATAGGGGPRVGRAGRSLQPRSVFDSQTRAHDLRRH